VLNGNENIVSHSNSHIIGSCITSLRNNTTHVNDLIITSLTSSINKPLGVSTNGLVVVDKFATFTIDLTEELFVDFYASFDLKINTFDIIFGSASVDIFVNSLTYSLTNLINQGDKITVESDDLIVVNLNVEYE
jgi:hypothetical protein